MTTTDDNQRGFGGVEKDPLDLRDALYEPSLRELPFAVDNRARAPMILDQLGEGACTGFALAAVANYLLANRSDTGPPDQSVSPRMLYEMAKRYDEWEGETQEGSSIRGAMKGWHKHGVCQENDWPYVEAEPGELTANIQGQAQQRPLGAYFRVRHLHLNHMHSALNEVGVLYASSVVHAGWHEIDPDDGKIPLRHGSIGRHAFAIVGYDEDGFWIQNSWGPTWGQNGFCHVSYDDWLENSSDCWVARLGVPTGAGGVAERPIGSRLAGFRSVPHEAVVHEIIKPHYVNLGNDGFFSRTGRYTTTPQEAKQIIHSDFKNTVAGWSGTPKLLLYAHGGLTGENQAAAKIYSMLPYFLANEIYPVHFIWETSLWDSVQGIVEDAFRRRPMLGWRDALRERFSDLLGGAIEIGARRLGRPIWAQMKDNAERASTDKGDATFLAHKIVEYQENGGTLELHLIGHSAGCIFHAYLAEQLHELKVPIKTLTLWAPACTIDLFTSHIAPHIGNGIERVTMFNLTDEYEQNDTANRYPKSLLYLVSNGLEQNRKEPILGMEVFAKDNEDVKNAFGASRSGNGSTVIYSTGDADDIVLRSRSTTHGQFDNDDDTLNSTLRIMRGENDLVRPFGDGA